MRFLVTRTAAATAGLACVSAAAIALMPRWFSDLVFGTPEEPSLVWLRAVSVGGVVAFHYFINLRGALRSVRLATWLQVVNSVAFAVLGAIGLFLSNRWLQPLLRHRMDPTSPIDERIRHRALLLPYAIALVTFIGWAVAGIVWGILPAHGGTFTVEKRFARSSAPR
jgi:amino acid transporter